MWVWVGGWVSGVWSHLHVNDASPTWMLIIFLIGFLDMVTPARDCKAASLCSCFSAIVLFSWFGCVYACVCLRVCEVVENVAWRHWDLWLLTILLSSTFIIIHLQRSHSLLIYPTFSVPLLIHLRQVPHRLVLKPCNQESSEEQTLK